MGEGLGEIDVESSIMEVGGQKLSSCVCVCLHVCVVVCLSLFVCRPFVVI